MRSDITCALPRAVLGCLGFITPFPILGPSHLLSFSILHETTLQRFKNGDFDVEDQHSGGREKVFEDAELEVLLEQDSCQNQEE